MGLYDFKARADRNINLKDFNTISDPILVNYTTEFRPLADRLYVLRMMIRSPDSGGFQIPEKLDWLRHQIDSLNTIQKQQGWTNPYVYVTVRHGIVTSETDDAWHVDGFSMRTPHVPEQNYIWSNSNPTEYVDQTFPIPEGFDAHKHNLHTLLGEMVKEENVKQVNAKYIYLIDPYCVHRRPTVPVGTMRSFWRVSFIPIEIEDDSCTTNPLMKKKRYNRTDIRKSLTRFPYNP